MQTKLLIDRELSQCTNCGWIGTDDKKIEVTNKLTLKMMGNSEMISSLFVCPDCAQHEFYVTPAFDLL